MNNMQHPQQYQQPPQHKLTTQQAAGLYEQKRAVDRDIYENLSQIRMLNNKMAKNDYEHTYLQKLKQRQIILHNKKRELQDILRTHQYLQQQVNINKKHELNFRNTLAENYEHDMQQKKKKKELQKRMQIEAEQEMLRRNQMIFNAEQERRRQQMMENKRMAMQELAEKERRKMREKQERERQKQQFNKKIQFRNNLETQKQAIYKQYYNHFMENQTNLQSVYNKKTAPAMNQRQRQRQEFLRKQQQQFARQQAVAQEQRMNRMNHQRDMLRTFLQNQMHQKQQRKSLENSQRKSFNEQLAQYQMTQKQYEQMQKIRKRQQQKRYDEQLASQVRLKQQVNRDSSPSQYRYHNPITNPIDFKMGITNPYVIKQYEQTKERYVGDRDLKLKHLAMVGNNSIAK